LAGIPEARLGSVRGPWFRKGISPALFRPFPKAMPSIWVWVHEMFKGLWLSELSHKFFSQGLVGEIRCNFFADESVRQMGDFHGTLYAAMVRDGHMDHGRILEPLIEDHKRRPAGMPVLSQSLICIRK
jgi:hypothetical protein